MRWARSARKHRIGKVHAIAVMEGCEPTIVPAEGEFDERLVWIGEDDRGVELEIVVLNLPACLLVIHVMPYQYRR